MKTRIAKATPYLLVAFLALLAVATISNVVRLNATNSKLRAQAQEGQNARTTQCRTFPIAIKLYTAAERFDLITPGDLKTYLAGGPRGCPSRP